MCKLEKFMRWGHKGDLNSKHYNNGDPKAVDRYIFQRSWETPFEYSSFKLTRYNDKPKVVIPCLILEDI